MSLFPSLAVAWWRAPSFHVHCADADELADFSWRAEWMVNVRRRSRPFKVVSACQLCSCSWLGSMLGSIALCVGCLGQLCFAPVNICINS